MADWMDFEIDCTDYLNDRFRSYAHFIHQGGADSTVPDILVETKHGNSFYMDAKHSPAQCGQFVLLPNLSSRTFEYSQKNVNHINIYAEKIIAHMNSQFDEFRDLISKGCALRSSAHGILFDSYHISSDRLDSELSNLFLCISL